MTETPASGTLGEAVRSAGRVLREGGIDTPETDARWLIAATLGLDRARLIADSDRVLNEVEQAAIGGAVAKRLSRMPVSRILGTRDFYGRSFGVTPDVLDPRADSETLIEAVLAGTYELQGPRILDIGTGSGCLLITLLAELPEATGTGLDLSGPALAVASENASRLGVSARATFIQADLFGSPAPAGAPFDIVVSNPPYIPTNDIAELDREVREHDPRLALDGGEDGLDAYRAILSRAWGWMVPGGLLVLELGAGQAPAVAGLAAGWSRADGRGGWQGITFQNDLAGHARVLICRRVP